MKKVLLLSLLSFLSFGMPKNIMKNDNLVGIKYKKVKDDICVLVKVTGNVNANISNIVLENLVNLKSKTKNVKFVFSESGEIKSDYTLIINLNSPEFGSENKNEKELVYNSKIRQIPYTSRRASGYEQNLEYPHQVQGTISLFNMNKSSNIVATLNLIKNDVSLKTISTKGKYDFFHAYAETKGEVSRNVYKQYKNLISKKAINFPSNDDMIDKTLEDLNKNIKKNIRNMNFKLE